MELTIYRNAGMWEAHTEQKVYPLVPDTRPLLRLVKAIHNTHPGSLVWIDSNISINPFLRQRLFTTRHYRLIPDYEAIQATLNHPEVRRCQLCDSEAWYTADRGMWQCARSKCSAYQYGNDNYWFKLSRHAVRK